MLELAAQRGFHAVRDALVAESGCALLVQVPQPPLDCSIDELRPLGKADEDPVADCVRSHGSDDEAHDDYDVPPVFAVEFAELGLENDAYERNHLVVVYLRKNQHAAHILS